MARGASAPSREKPPARGHREMATHRRTPTAEHITEHTATHNADQNGAHQHSAEIHRADQSGAASRPPTDDATEPETRETIS